MIDVCPFQTLSVIDLLRLVHGRLEGNRPPGRGAFFVMSLDFSKFAPVIGIC